jgi:hypothetical protein
VPGAEIEIEPGDVLHIAQWSGFGGADGGVYFAATFAACVPCSLCSSLRCGGPAAAPADLPHQLEARKALPAAPTGSSLFFFAGGA